MVQWIHGSIQFEDNVWNDKNAEWRQFQPFPLSPTDTEIGFQHENDWNSFRHSFVLSFTISTI